MLIDFLSTSVYGDSVAYFQMETKLLSDYSVQITEVRAIVPALDSGRILNLFSDAKFRSCGLIPNRDTMSKDLSSGFILHRDVKMLYFSIQAPGI